MSVGLKVNFFWYPLGDEDFVHSFFSTISYHLENGEWGTKYPILFDKLYQGKLSWKNAEKVIEELKDIQVKLKAFAPDKVIWDIDDLSLQPPWGNDISTDITDLSNYFVTSEGEDVFEVFFKALNTAIENQSNLTIEDL